ncbi:hypothetical protein CCY99_03560 [Helicobacter sp. 16-1353]|uniref:GTPase n=1 Tax=Helicobacter sp. 16-1353 TaxID=2004996 RepID=UPI000DCBB618|nr:GTPase [Helicobacter sp. 16-1353]RAX54437.1 hypothetical protein CCY99_03560 [Helicobacter sp. 16-1353]
MSKMDKYLSREDIKILEILRKNIQNNVVKITCTGLYNHGKSSLMNALIDDFEEKTFKIGDVRTTAKNKSFVYENIEYIDTPGLNARENDDKRAIDAIREADFNIFVHNGAEGEFNQPEMNFLHHIKSNWDNPNDFINKNIFVLSRADSLQQSDIDKISNKMKRQIIDIFGTPNQAINNKVIATSSKNYIKGKKENKNRLVENSNIDKIRVEINTLIEKYGNTIMQAKKNRLALKCDEYIQKLKTQRERIQLEKDKLENQRAKLARKVSEWNAHLNQ